MLYQDEPEYALLSRHSSPQIDSESSIALEHAPSRQCNRGHGFWVSAWIMSIIVAVLLPSPLMNIRRSPVELIAELNTFFEAPLYRDIDLHLHRTIPDGSLWDNATNIWRQDPSPAVDAAWHGISMSNPILLSREDIIKLGKSVDGSVQWPFSDEELYVGKMNGFHLLHCLNAIRQTVFSEYYWPNGTTHPGHMPHIRHCIDILRQELMCTFSLDVHTFTWVEHYSTPMADFMLQRQCRRWDDIVRWKESHQMSDEDNERVDRLQKPHGVFENALPGGAADLLDQTAEWLKHSHVA